MSSMDQLVVRRSQRHDVALHGRFRIASDHESSIVLARASGVRNGVIEADVVDLSGGGLGMLTPVFVPKQALLECQILLPQSSAPALECQARVTRVIMTDRRPMYLIGLLFEAMSDQAAQALSKMLADMGPENERG